MTSTHMKFYTSSLSLIVLVILLTIYILRDNSFPTTIQQAVAQHVSMKAITITNLTSSLPLHIPAIINAMNAGKIHCGKQTYYPMLPVIQQVYPEVKQAYDLGYTRAGCSIPHLTNDNVPYHPISPRQFNTIRIMAKNLPLYDPAIINAMNVARTNCTNHASYRPEIVSTRFYPKIKQAYDLGYTVAGCNIPRLVGSPQITIPSTNATQEYQAGYIDGVSAGRSDFLKGEDLMTHLTLNDIKGSINYRQDIGMNGWMLNRIFLEHVMMNMV